MQKLFVCSLVFATTTSAFAHAHLKSSEPAANSRLSQAPQHVVLRFTEPVVVKMSTFRVRRVENAAEARSHLAEWLRPSMTSGTVDAQVATTGTSGEVTLDLKSALRPGTYAVLWKALTNDGHARSDEITFEVGR